MKLFIASNNQHKIREIDQIFKSFGLTETEFLFPKQLFSDIAEPIESGNTFDENAEIKAVYYNSLSGITTIADDSGLEIDVLNGAPGVHSARFSGPAANDSKNRIKVLELLNGVDPAERTARFKTSICLLTKTTKIFFEGICEGLITNKEIGNNGFGYDSIFIPIGFNSTFAEMEAEQKNILSHRGIAIKKLAYYLATHNL